MKIDLIKKIGMIGLSFVNINNVFASDNIHNVNKNINWWKIGSEYQSTPAFGWISCTFLIFLVIILYYGYMTFSKIFNTRSEQIKKDIMDIRQLKTIAHKKLTEYTKKVKLLDLELNSIVSEFKNKSTDDQKTTDKNISEFKDQISKDVDNMIQSNIQQIRMNLKKVFIRDVILEVIKKTKTENLGHINKKYEQKIIKDLSNIKTNIL